MLETSIIVYYTLAITFIAAAYRIRSGGSWVAQAIISLGIPFAGLPLALTGFLAEHVSRRETGVSRFEEIAGLDKVKWDTPGRPDVDKEINMIPLEEALTMSDHQTRRRFVLDTLKEESLEWVPFLTRAVRNEDSETSHYAVTALLEMKRTMTAELQRHAVVYHREPERIDAAVAYADCLKRYIGSGLMDAKLEWTSRFAQAEVLDRLIEASAGSEAVYAERVVCAIALERYDEARETCESFLRDYPDSELAYVTALSLYFTLRMSDKFERVLERLKRAPIKVSNRTLQMIRYWNQGGKQNDEIEIA